jgi:ABC-type dipeptide/oligopeptide/nickel transport system ATPase subunit
MGSTGSGKSTIAAYFGNFPLVGVKDEKKGEFKIEGKNIASEYGSCTEVPNEIKGVYKKE